MPSANQPAASLSSGSAPSLLTARLLVLTAALLWSSGGFFAKFHAIDDWPGPLRAFWRAAFACVVLLPMIRRPQWSWKLIPATLIFAAMNYTYLTAMAKGTAANAIWLQSTAQMWVLLVGVLVFRERAVFRDWLLVVLCGLGIAFILAFEAQGKSMEAVLYGLSSGIFYAGVVLSLRQMREFESAWLVGLNHLVTAIVLSPWAIITYQSGEHWPSGWLWLLLAGFGIVQMGLPYVLFARGLKTIPGHEASGIGLLEPLLVPIWAYFVTAGEEIPKWWTLVGGGFIFAGLVVRYLGSARAETQEELPPVAP
ncbi:MAG: DMT family transporter [Pirellulaceae bacterium]